MAEAIRSLRQTRGTIALSLAEARDIITAIDKAVAELITQGNAMLDRRNTVTGTAYKGHLFVGGPEFIRPPRTSAEARRGSDGHGYEDGHAATR